jgi:hypothetical protein
MVNITLAIPEDLKEELQKHEEVNWSAVVRRALKEHLKRIELVEAIAQKSKLTEKDAEELARKVKKEMARRHDLVKG